MAGTLRTATKAAFTAWKSCRPDLGYTCCSARGLVVTAQSQGGRVIHVHHAENLQWQETHDQFSLLSRVELNEFGYPAVLRDAAGVTTQIRYDELHQKVEVVRGTEVTRFRWDAVGNMIDAAAPARSTTPGNSISTAISSLAPTHLAPRPAKSITPKGTWWPLQIGQASGSNTTGTCLVASSRKNSSTGACSAMSTTLPGRQVKNSEFRQSPNNPGRILHCRELRVPPYRPDHERVRIRSIGRRDHLAEHVHDRRDCAEHGRVVLPHYRVDPNDDIIRAVRQGQRDLLVPSYGEPTAGKPDPRREYDVAPFHQQPETQRDPIAP